LNNATFAPFSDFALHHMGSNLADGITQGVAGPDEFRTAPLWGVGQRLFFLHDGRTSNLLQAIQAHRSGPAHITSIFQQSFFVNGEMFDVNPSGSLQFTGTSFPNPQSSFSGSEANAVINAFDALSASNQQDVLNFLRSL
jgi:CxxC motif-containing protein (DUF1111 family)